MKKKVCCIFENETKNLAKTGAVFYCPDFKRNLLKQLIATNQGLTNS